MWLDAGSPSRNSILASAMAGQKKSLWQAHWKELRPPRTRGTPLSTITYLLKSIKIRHQDTKLTKPYPDFTNNGRSPNARPSWHGEMNERLTLCRQEGRAGYCSSPALAAQPIINRMLQQRWVATAGSHWWVQLPSWY